MTSQFKVISISYKTSSLELRERIALNEDECKALLLKIKDVFGISEVVVLSTCNRTEIYYLADKDCSIDLVKLLSAQKGVDSALILSHIETFSEEKGLEYVFEVATGLHSQVIGDLQIPNQIKNAYQWSADMDMAGPFIHRLMHSVFFVNKRVVQETGFRDGAASTSYATVETMESFLHLLNEPKILVLGLGEIGQDVVKTLDNKGYTNFTVTNRTYAKSEELATTLKCDILPFEDVKTELKKFDIVISSIRTEEPFIDLETVKGLGHKSVKYFVDLSVPRSISPDIQKVPGMVLYDLDEIQVRANRALEGRKSSVPAVKNIITEAVSDFGDWSNQMVVSPTIQKLKGALEQIRKEEMSKYVKSLSKEEAIKMDKITSSMMQKVIKLPVLQLKAACKRGEAETLIDVLNNLFDLEKVNS
ncbi:glutamyl-tRNA reductase [Arcticibacterium luteifluviistationis]|uniref:Glutamyl-tRNA reductase n=1 Tax=Arcticibacterium luteifluviistationis TaxID=1784714 RepID=A0A2Z4G993_9BACT|nr:glutamyl-tRNA reductase [Arcticibacterium luteifluviistationis]AWV97809.1 glutamyl-tRNA reductase [Arcticibacterium luteifluviistationis]